MTTATAAERFLDALHAAGCPPRKSGRGWSARCPAHEDHNPSLSVTPIEGQVLIHCHAGCDTDAVLDALHLARRDLFDEPRGATYLYDSGRVVHRTPDKDFWQSGNTSTMQLYRLARVTQGVASDAVIYLVEGEKDVHALESVGAIATTAPAGWENIGKVDVSALKGARVVAVVDRDGPGAKWAAIVRDRLDGYAASLTLVEAKQGKDAADHIAAGHRLDHFAPFAFAEEPALDPDALRAAAVDREAERVRVQREAKRLVDAEEASAVEVPPFDAGLLDDILARPAEPPHRIEGLLPTGGRLLATAQRKTGKTTWLLNLAHDLLYGKPFLDQFPVRPLAGRVAILNYEVTAAQLAGWAAAVDVPRDRLLLVNLRGRRNPLSFDQDRDRLAALLRAHHVELLMVDPFGRAYDGKSQNDPGEVTNWLVRLDQFADQAGAAEMVLTAHAGWDGERTRGASSLEDWADSLVTLVRDKDDASLRYMRATGRDVDVEEDRLAYDRDSRRLTLTGAGSRKVADTGRKLEALVTACVEIVSKNPGLNVTEIRRHLRADAVPFRTNEDSQALRQAEQRGLIRVATHGQARLHYLAEGVSLPALPTTPGEPCAALPPLSIGRGALGAVPDDQHSPTCRRCGQRLLLVTAGRDTCERCRLEAGATP